MILDRLKDGVVIGDGGALFELEHRGYVSAGPFTPEATLDHPEVIRQLHVDYARAGSDVLQSVTYYAHEAKLKSTNRADVLREMNELATRMAREVADEYGCLVAGDLANTWVYRADDPASHTETRRQFDQQIEYQLPEGTDFFIAETIEQLGEALIALDAIKATGQPAMITLGFKYQDKTLDGVVLEEAFQRLVDAGADIVGINCFRDPVRMLPLAERLRQAVSGYVATQPVGFRCTDDRPYFQIQQFEGRVAFPLELDPFMLARTEMADYAVRARDMGVNYIGACCGTGPHHIRAMAEALGRTVPNSKYSPQVALHPIVGSEENIREADARVLAEQRGKSGSA